MEFRRDVLAMAAEGNRTVVQREHNLDIALRLIYEWQQRYRIQAGTVQVSEARAEEAELRRRRELEIVRQERDISRKSAAGDLAGEW